MRILSIALIIVAYANSSASGYLGTFTPASGYDRTAVVIGIWNDVSYYNAGQFGTSVGNQPGPIAIAADSGLWEVTGEVGGYYASSAARNAAVGGAPPYPPPIPPPPGRVGAYIQGNHSPGRTDDGALAFRNEAPLGTGTAKYQYTLDNFDLNGVDPTKLTSGALVSEFYFCPNPADALSPGGAPLDKFTMSFRDSLGNTGFQWGYTRDNQVRWRTNTSSNWKYTGNIADSANWDGVRVNLDLSNDNFQMEYFDFTSGFWGTIVPAGTSLGTAMKDFAGLGWELVDGVVTGTGGKNFFDDFTFCVTEAPLSALLDGGTLCSGDKQFSDFSYHGGGDMPAAEDIFVKAITDADGNVGIRFQGAFVDAAGGGASDALIDFLVTAPEGKLIKDVHMAANPLVVGGGNTAGLVSVTETFLADNDQTVLSVFDLKPGSRKLTDWADLVDADGNLAPVQQLHVQKDIIAWAQQLGSAATMSFIDQTFSQCDADPANSGVCRVVDPPMGHPGDFNGDGMVNAADYSVWRNGLGSIYTQADYEIWKAHFGESWPPGSSATSSVAVPEPTSWAMAGVCLATLLFWQGRSTLLSHELRQYPPPATPV